MAHHEIFSYGQSNLNYSTGIIDTTVQLSGNEAWGLGNIPSYIDLHKKRGDINAKDTYYYVDFPNNKLRYINLCEVDNDYFIGLSKE